MAARKTRDEKKCDCGTKQPRLKAVLNINEDSEADRLWRHALIGTGTCISLIEQYIDVEMLNPPFTQIRELRDRLDEILL